MIEIGAHVDDRVHPWVSLFTPRLSDMFCPCWVFEALCLSAQGCLAGAALLVGVGLGVDKTWRVFCG